jgi:hypothetical protein
MKQKLTLDLAALEVETFVTFVPESRRGTVHANGSCQTFSCPPGTCGIVPDSTAEKDGDFAATPFCSQRCCV